MAIVSTTARARVASSLPPGALRLGGAVGRRLSGAAGLAAALLAAERARLAPWLAVALAAGVVGYFAMRVEPDPAWRWAALPPLLLALVLLPRAPLAAWAVGLAAAAALGAAIASWQAGRMPPMPDLPRGATIVAGTVLRVDLLPEEGRRVTLGAPSLDGGAPLARQIRIRLRAEDPVRPAPGERLTVRALVRPPASPAYPGAWDFQRAAWFSGLAGSGFAIGRAEVAAPSDSQASAGPPPLAGLRAAMEARILATLPDATGAIAAALIAGGQSAIPQTDMASMRDSGLAHILSVSGLHIAIVMGVSFGVVRLLLAAMPFLALRLPVKACAAVAALAAGGFYLVLTGEQVPMQRSFAMAALATLTLLAGRRALTLRAWALAFAVVVLVEPVAVLGPSFQMSFAAVLALVAGWEALRPRLERLPPERGWLRRVMLVLFGVVATSLLAGAATTPFGLHHFGRLQLYGVVANALAVPVTSFLVMPAGMAAALLMPLGLEGLALAPMGWGIEAILWVARWVAGWPGAAVSVPPIPVWGLGLAALGMLWLCLWGGRWRWLGVPLVLAGVLGAPAASRPPDILVSADARLIAWHGDGVGLLLQRLSGASNLTRDSWLRLYAVEAARPFPAGVGTQAGGAVACQPGACRLRRAEDGGANPATTAILLRGTGGGGEAQLRMPSACEPGVVAVVVAAEPVRGAARCPGVAVIDRFAVWRNGAHAIWLEPGGAARVLSDREARGARPWVPPPPQPRGGAPAREPPEPTE